MRINLVECDQCEEQAQLNDDGTLPSDWVSLDDNSADFCSANHMLEYALSDDEDEEEEEE